MIDSTTPFKLYEWIVWDTFGYARPFDWLTNPNSPLT